MTLMNRIVTNDWNEKSNREAKNPLA